MTVQFGFGKRLRNQNSILLRARVYRALRYLGADYWAPLIVLKRRRYDPRQSIEARIKSLFLGLGVE